MDNQGQNLADSWCWQVQTAVMSWLAGSLLFTHGCFVLAALRHF
jgi:hypothetical protein